MKKLLLLLLLSNISIPTLVYAQQPGMIDTTFNPGDIGFAFGDGANSDVFTIAVQNDGKIIIGGAFTSYNGTGRNYIARLNSEGSLDNDFNVGTSTNNAVNTIAIQSDGKIIIGGAFTNYNGTVKNCLARLNADGTLDNTFTVGTGANSGVLTTCIQSDGKIVIGGKFTSYNGTSSNHLARLNVDGSLDNTFNVGTGANSDVLTTAIQSDGKIIIGGAFTFYNGITINRIARLNADGSLDNTFNVGTGANNIVKTISIQSDGKIIMAGFFSNYKGTSRNCITRLNADGSLDNTFSIGTGANNFVETSILQSDGKIVIGGWFTAYNGTSRNGITRLNADGTLDNAFAGETGASMILIFATTIQSDGKIIIGGSFTKYNGTTINRIGRLNANGSIDNTFNGGTGANNGIRATAIQSDGKIVIGGKFTSYNGTSSNHLARLNADGSLDKTFNVGTGANSDVLTTAIQNDGKIIIGGDFTSYNEIVKNRITRLNADGTHDNTFNVGTGTNYYVNTITIQSDGKIIIGGNFTSYNGTSINRIARLNADGTLDNTFNVGTGANDQVYTIAIQSDGKIIFGGGFTFYNGKVIKRLARLNADGTLDNTFNVGTGTSDYVYTITIQSNGKIIIGGYFTSYNGISRNNIARLNADGSLDNTFTVGAGPNFFIYTTALQSDGKIIIGGGFTNYNGTSRNYIARLNSDGSIDNAFTVGAGASDKVFTTALQSDGKIIIGGEFTSYNGTGRNRIARIEGLPLISLTVQDFISIPTLKIFPNPTCENVTIKYSLSSPSLAVIDLYNVAGEKIKSIANCIQPLGDHQYQCDLSGLKTGIYFVKGNLGTNTFTEKLVIQ